MSGTENPSVVRWYQQQTVFVTGGSGFLGKCLLFKLLQTGVPKIYLLIRTKKGQSPQKRLDELLNLDIYEDLLKKDPGLRSRAVAVAGDTTVDGLALSDADRLLLQDEVTVVFHVAASVKFDDPLSEAVRYNLTSTRDVVELARGMKNLKSLQYVSTAYCNIEHVTKDKGVEEKVYKSKMSWRKLVEFTESSTPEIVNAMTKKILGSSLNTYIFTKHLAESLMEEAAEDLPVVITRPAIVSQAIREPLPGWIGNLSSPVVIFGGTAKGILRTYFGRGSSQRAYVPVDTTVNAMILASWRESTRETKIEKVPVINFDYCPNSSQESHELGLSMLDTNPPHNALWVMHFISTESRHVFLFLHLILHVLPAIFLDTLLRLSGNQPRMVKIYRKLYVALYSLRAITNHSDVFSIKNYHDLYAAIPKEDKEKFELFIPKRVETNLSYLRLGMIGFRRYLNEPTEYGEKDRIHQRRLLILDQVFLSIVMTLIFMYFPYFLILQPLNYIYDGLVNFFTTL